MTIELHDTTERTLPMPPRHGHSSRDTRALSGLVTGASFLAGIAGIRLSRRPRRP